eukprot:3974691-Pyramimonas_sp.AAC.1
MSGRDHVDNLLGALASVSPSLFHLSVVVGRQSGRGRQPAGYPGAQFVCDVGPDRRDRHFC